MDSSTQRIAFQSVLAALLLLLTTRAPANPPETAIIFPATCEEYILNQGRWSDEAAGLRRAWDEVRDATGADPGEAFRRGFRFARCLDEVGGYSLLFWSKSLERVSLLNWETPMEQVTSRCLEWYGDMDPTPENRRAAGWLSFWYGRCKCREGSSREAIAYAQKAEGIAEDTGDELLLAWSRILEAQAEFDDGNHLGSYAILERCRRDAGDRFGDNFQASLAIRYARCERELGLWEKARSRALDTAENPDVHQYLQVRLLYEYGLGEMTRGATEEALGPFAIIRRLIPHAEFWSSQAGNRWNEILGRTPEELFAQHLVSVRKEGRSLEQAAFALELAGRAGDGDDPDIETALHLLDEAGKACPDRRVRITAALMRTRWDGSGTETVARKALADAGDDRDLLRRRLSEIQWGLKSVEWEDWLENNRSLLPEDIYLLERSKLVQWRDRDCEAAAELHRAVIGSHDREADKYLAYLSLIPCLVKTGDIEGMKRLVERFEYSALDDCWRERVLYYSGYYVSGENPEAGIWLYDRVLATRRQPNWYRLAVVRKARTLVRLEKAEIARQALEELVTWPPFKDGADGRPMVDARRLLAEIHEGQLKDLGGAEAHYAAIIDASPVTLQYLDMGYEPYIEFLLRHKRWADGMALCERGLRELPTTFEHTRAFLEVCRVECLRGMGRREEASAELTRLQEEELPLRAASKAKRLRETMER